MTRAEIIRISDNPSVESLVVARHRAWSDRLRLSAFARIDGASTSRFIFHFDRCLTHAQDFRRTSKSTDRWYFENYRGNTQLASAKKTVLIRLWSHLIVVNEPYPFACPIDGGCLTCSPLVCNYLNHSQISLMHFLRLFLCSSLISRILATKTAGIICLSTKVTCMVS